MIAAVHALVGAALGAWVGRPDLAAAAGLVSHAVLDAIPHTDYRHTRDGLLDALAAAGVAWLAAARLGPAAGWGAVAGMLPDLEVALKHLGLWPFRRCLFPSHNDLLPHPQVAPPLGVLTQLAVAGLAGAALVLR